MIQGPVCKHRATIVGLAVSIALLSGCGFKGVASETRDSAERQPHHDAWAIHPVRMRVYPSTRFVREDDTTILEARVEFYDENGDQTKAVGQLRFELSAAGKASQPILGARLYSWSVPVYSREDNQTFYDPITRAYLFRLKLDSLTMVSETTRLQVTFLPASQGPRLQAGVFINRESGVIEPHLVVPE